MKGRMFDEFVMKLKSVADAIIANKSQTPSVISLFDFLFYFPAMKYNAATTTTTTTRTNKQTTKTGENRKQRNKQTTSNNQLKYTI